VVTILALAAAVLYGTADFLGGVASRRASVFAVLVTTVPAGAAVVIVVALLGETPGLGSLLGHGLASPASVGSWGAAGWAALSGICGAAGLVAFYAGFAAAPISVVAPVAALVSTVLPVGIAIADGERPTSRMLAGGLICLVAIVLVSASPAGRTGTIRAPGLSAGCAAWDTASLRGRGSACSSCASRMPGSPACSGRWRSPGRREPWSPWA
jgi:drug/metabolite transporter (DMT)-like permease